MNLQEAKTVAKTGNGAGAIDGEQQADVLDGVEGGHERAEGDDGPADRGQVGASLVPSARSRDAARASVRKVP